MNQQGRSLRLSCSQTVGLSPLARHPQSSWTGLAERWKKAHWLHHFVHTLTGAGVFREHRDELDTIPVPKGSQPSDGYREVTNVIQGEVEARELCEESEEGFLQGPEV